MYIPEVTFCVLTEKQHLFPNLMTGLPKIIDKSNNNCHCYVGIYDLILCHYDIFLGWAEIKVSLVSSLPIREKMHLPVWDHPEKNIYSDVKLLTIRSVDYLEQNRCCCWIFRQHNYNRIPLYLKEGMALYSWGFYSRAPHIKTTSMGKKKLEEKHLFFILDWTYIHKECALTVLYWNWFIFPDLLVLQSLGYLTFSQANTSYLFTIIFLSLPPCLLGGL